MPIAIASRSTRPLRSARAAAAPDVALPIATTWLVLGCLGVLAVPALRGTSNWFGWLPFWLVLMPAAQCLILRWRPLLAASHTTLVRVHARRRVRATRIARPNRRSPQQRSIWAVAFCASR